MLTKEELQHTYIEYDSSITEEIFNKILKIAKDFQEEICPEFKPYNWFENNFKDFCNNGFFWFGPIGKFSYGVDNYKGVNSINKQIYPEDILGEETQFEVGKWYKFNNPDYIGNCYAKFSKLSEYCNYKYFHFSEYIGDNKHKFYNGSWEFKKCLYKLEDLLEIQKYLPVGHPDLIVKKLTVDNSELDKYDIEGNLIETKHKFKVEDWVIGWHSEFNNYKNTAWKIEEIKNGYAYSSKKDRHNTSLDNLRLATSEEITKATKPTFEFNKWYKYPNKKTLIFIKEDLKDCYGFTAQGWWKDNWNISDISLDNYIPATTEEIQERLLSFAKEKYTVGTKYKCLINKDICEIRNNFIYKNNVIEDSDIGILFDGGQWAEIISEPITETKTFDRNWYVEVNSQEEADALKGYIISKGELVYSDWTVFDNYKYVCCTELNEWYVRNKTDGKIQKQLSEILPNYSKVNRNVYYEVENQEQYLEILDWLESKGEKIDKKSSVTNIWKYIYYYNGIWILLVVKPNLPKAEFQFKSKQKCEVCESKGGETRNGFCDPCPECNEDGYIKGSISHSPISTIKSIPEVETVINRFKAQPIKKRVLPEIY